jgi:RNA polymerase sigma-70 factor (ECF subfamily)
MRPTAVEAVTPSDLERLYREEGARLWRAVLLWSGDPHVASDAVAEAFAQALRRGEAIRSPAAWVWRVAFRVAAADLQRGRRLEPIDDRMADGRADPATGDDLMDLMRALRGLPAKQRAAVILHHYAGYPRAEVARIIGSTTSAVGVHLHRGRRRLRRSLEVDDD